MPEEEQIKRPNSQSEWRECLQNMQGSRDNERLGSCHFHVTKKEHQHSEESDKSKTICGVDFERRSMFGFYDTQSCKSERNRKEQTITGLNVYTTLECTGRSVTNETP
jgi:hypothetical protein